MWYARHEGGDTHSSACFACMWTRWGLVRAPCPPPSINPTRPPSTQTVSSLVLLLVCLSLLSGLRGDFRADLRDGRPRQAPAGRRPLRLLQVPGRGLHGGGRPGARGAPGISFKKIKKTGREEWGKMGGGDHVHPSILSLSGGGGRSFVSPHSRPTRILVFGTGAHRRLLPAAAGALRGRLPQGRGVFGPRAHRAALRVVPADAEGGGRAVGDRSTRGLPLPSLFSLESNVYPTF